jgi:predicted lactoylglutathione lyase|tara:strand:+ start:138 stop:299 length:162 start_codon:yes stop_codon:yes gene_type:complete
MELGAFSINLPVKDKGVSSAFHEKLDFEVSGEDREYYVVDQCFPKAHPPFRDT